MIGSCYPYPLSCNYPPLFPAISSLGPDPLSARKQTAMWLQGESTRQLAAIKHNKDSGALRSCPLATVGQEAVMSHDMYEYGRMREGGFMKGIKTFKVIRDLLYIFWWMLVALFRVYLDSILLNFPIFKGVAPIFSAQIHNILIIMLPQCQMHFRSRIWILIPYFSVAYKMLLTILLWSISSDKYSAFTQNRAQLWWRIRGVMGLTLFSSYTHGCD